MKLRNKVTIILLVLWCVMITVAYVGSQLILSKSYLDLERNEANDSLQRVEEAIQQLTSSISIMAANWAVWDDTYKFVVGENNSYKKINLVLSSFVTTDVEMMLYFDASGKSIATMAVNQDKTAEIPIPTGFFNYLYPGSLLVDQPQINSEKQGLVAIPSGILLVASHAILTSNNQGPSHGALVMAKYLSPAVIAKIKSLTKINLSMHPLLGKNIGAGLRDIYASLLKNDGHVLERKSPKNMIGFRLLKDLYGKPIAIIQAEMPRNLYQLGQKTIKYYNAAFMVYSLIIIILLWYLLQNLLVKRLERLKGQIGNVDENNHYFNNLTSGISDEVSSVASLYHQATHDPLTGLANRNLLDQAFNSHLNIVNADKSKIALFFLDIDHFKRVNDTLGHEVGDALLISIAKQLNSCLRDHDIAARIGGDEFVVMLRGINSDQIKVVVERIYKALSQTVQIQDHELYLESSMGISIYPDDGTDMATLLKNADIALYHAKASGRNHYQYYSYELNQTIQEAYKKEAELQRAISNKELRLFYQPIFDVVTKKVISLEAMVRWRHPQRGLLGASEVIPLAEKSGLIIPIGKWVLATACRQAKAWQDKGLKMVPVAVNISVLQTKNTSLSRLVNEVLTHTGLPPHLLELELTETSYIELTETILDDMRLLKSKGVKLVVDDFGAGYSGLGYLRRLPISKLKIDKSFIDELHNNPDDRAITLAIIAISHQLDLQVIAEGVKTAEQYEFLKMNNVDAAQGSYFCQPLDEAACEEFLNSIHAEETC